MRGSNQKTITKLVAQAKEFDSYIAKHGQKSRICSAEQVDLMKFILEAYNAFLPDMSPNSCGYFGPEEWAVDKHKARESVRVWWKEANHFVTHEDQQSYDNDDPEEPSLRFPRMKALLATYPSDGVLQRVIGPLFLHHRKAYVLMPLMTLFVLCCPEVSDLFIQILHCLVSCLVYHDKLVHSLI